MKRLSNTYPDQPESITLDWSIHHSERVGLRRRVVEKLLEERPYTKYRYNVEACSSGRHVYLTRPTPLNKGFDFQVNLEGFRTRLPGTRRRRSEKPSHADVLDDLRRKVAAWPDRKVALYRAVGHIFACGEPVDVLRHRGNLEEIDSGLPMDQVLAVLKWLFIEQDMAYWLYRGRDKLMGHIETEVFEF